MGLADKLQMADIARLAGVSTATVSRALSGSKLINDETRTRILELARSLNYTVNVGAKNLRMGENRTIGVVIPYDSKSKQALSEPFFLSMVGVLASALTDQNYEMLLSRVDEDDMVSIADLYTSGRVAGLIVIGQWHHHDDLNSMALRKVPLVVWGARMPQQLYCSVGSDNELGGYQATVHLLNSGCRKILFLGDVTLPEAEARYQGYVRAHTELNIPLPQGLTLSLPFEASAARAILSKRLEKLPLGFDGLFASSDLQAFAAISLMNELGLDVPGQVQVVGYDDIEIARHFRPRLSTIRQPVELAGTAMLNSLIQQIKGEGCTSVSLPTQLIVRESSGMNPDSKP